MGFPSKGCITVMLAENFKEGSNPKGYMMSEKLDGVITYLLFILIFLIKGSMFLVQIKIHII